MPSSEPDVTPEIANQLCRWADQEEGASLISPAEADGFAALLASLGVGYDSCYAECRLGGDRQLDLLLSYGRNSTHLPALRHCIAERRQHASAEARSAWAAAQRFVDAWADDTSALSRTVSTIWLEMDDVTKPALAAAPSLSACVVPSYGPDYDPRSAQREHLSEALLITDVAFRGRGRASELTERLNHAVRELPTHGRFIHLSLMTGRATPALKLYGVCPSSELVDYLARLGFAGRLDLLGDFLRSEVLTEMTPEDVYFDLNLSTMSDAATASLGVAFSQQNQLALAPRDGARRQLMNRLIALGYSTSAQAETLARWVELPPSRKTPLVSGDVIARRWLDLKLVLDAGGHWSTKAYLGFARLRPPFLFMARGGNAASA
jgi:hypothetical protein